MGSSLSISTALQANLFVQQLEGDAASLFLQRSCMSVPITSKSSLNSSECRLMHMSPERSETCSGHPPLLFTLQSTSCAVHHWFQRTARLFGADRLCESDQP
ncbi:hypothetical protein ANANG_G00303350 [Anguilla anguilla]|uniref:Uncharacterized protein n=1 Tax=Anguilla anguilla TaxID=7936 RepID=A0A9D3RI47_ANGAN|nr:hypothetical protein ANANG_G00303350 [Anguilla anguilla]